LENNSIIAESGVINNLLMEVETSEIPPFTARVLSEPEILSSAEEAFGKFSELVFTFHGFTSSANESSKELRFLHSQLEVNDPILFKTLNMGRNVLLITKFRNKILTLPVLLAEYLPNATICPFSSWKSIETLHELIYQNLIDPIIKENSLRVSQRVLALEIERAISVRQEASILNENATLKTLAFVNCIVVSEITPKFQLGLLSPTRLDSTLEDSFPEKWHANQELVTFKYRFNDVIAELQGVKMMGNIMLILTSKARTRSPDKWFLDLSTQKKHEVEDFAFGRWKSGGIKNASTVSKKFGLSLENSEQLCQYFFSDLKIKIIMKTWIKLPENNKRLNLLGSGGLISRIQNSLIKRGFNRFIGSRKESSALLRLADTSLFNICDYVSWKDLVSLSMTCSRLNTVSNSVYLWQKHVQKHFAGVTNENFHWKYRFMELEVARKEKKKEFKERRQRLLSFPMYRGFFRTDLFYPPQW